MIEIETPGEWDKAGWKCTERGNYQNHIGEIDMGDIMLWVYAAGDSFGVKIGTSTRLRDSTHVETNIDEEPMAKLKAIEFMRQYPTKEEAKKQL